jgi:hypothetical protein
MNFDDVRTFLSNVPYIHDGGCGVAALSMYRWLEKNGMIKPKIILWYDYPQRYYFNKKALKKSGKKFREKVIAPNHCGISYKEKIIDCKREGLEEIDEIRQITNEKGLLIIINKAITWNPDFRRTRIPEIGEKLGIDLSDVLIR